MSTKDVKELAIEQAKKFGGKLEVCPKVPIETKADLGIAYTPGVA
ncbi:NADP-dependent malic enzyme, partial [Listeria monocytogenes]|nr:NADP-dependent malic enzyme [Listeria monocytogenes]